MEFMGYVRPDGKVGARNYVGVIPSVTCANDVAQAICRLGGTVHVYDTMELYLARRP